jgi:large subunit ribosomal protein L7/L12
MNKRLEQLLKKQEELKAQIQKIKAVEASSERKKDTRRKVLLGALVMKRMMSDEAYSKSVMKQLDEFLTRDSDRVLFGLLPKAGETSPDEAGKNQKTK